MTTELQAAAAEIEHKNEPSAPSSDEVDTHINSLYNDALSSRDGYGNAHDDANAIRAHIASLEADNKRLREALQFYADSANYETRWTHSMFECQDCGSGAIIDDDCGEIAKAALAQADGKVGK